MFTRRWTVAVVFLICVLAATLTVSAALAKSHKVPICHRPPENPDNVRLISVSMKALPDHLAHGDHWSFGGACYVRVSSDEGMFLDQWDAYCADNFGGHVTSIHSEAENDFVRFVINPAGVGGVNAMIGGYRIGNCIPLVGWEGAWTDGTPWDYQNWRKVTSGCASGEPKCNHDLILLHSFYGDQECLSGWNDIPGPFPLSVCRYEP
jgi:hypothetical protein